MSLANKYFHFKLQLSAKAKVPNCDACKWEKSNLTCQAQYWEEICKARLILDVTVADVAESDLTVQTLTNDFRHSCRVSLRGTAELLQWQRSKIVAWQSNILSWFTWTWPVYWPFSIYLKLFGCCPHYILYVCMQVVFLTTSRSDVVTGLVVQCELSFFA